MSASRRTLLGGLGTAFLSGCSSPRGSGRLDPMYPVPATPDNTKAVTVRKIGQLNNIGGSIGGLSFVGDTIALQTRDASGDRNFVGLNAHNLRQLWQVPQFIEPKPYRTRQLLVAQNRWCF